MQGGAHSIAGKGSVTPVEGEGDHTIVVEGKGQVLVVEGG